MNIYFVTTNKGKVESISTDLKPYNISIIQKSIDLTEPRSSDVQEIAQYKMNQAYKQIRKPTIVVDAGFYIDCINGFLRTFVNFTLETIGTEGILNLVKGKLRTCEFRECLAYMDEELNEPQYFISHVRESIAETERGHMQDHLWSKLTLIIPKDSNKTLAEMSYEECLEWRNTLREKNSLGLKLYNWISMRTK